MYYRTCSASYRLFMVTRDASTNFLETPYPTYLYPKQSEVGPFRKKNLPGKIQFPPWEKKISVLFVFSRVFPFVPKPFLSLSLYRQSRKVFLGGASEKLFGRSIIFDKRKMKEASVLLNFQSLVSYGFLVFHALLHIHSLPLPFLIQQVFIRVIARKSLYATLQVQQ